MDLFDLALKFNDFKWAEELVKAVEVVDNSDVEEETSDKVTMFDKEAVALENITTQYAVKENGGIRAFNINSAYDRNEAELVIVESPGYSIGNTVKYYIPSKIELTYMRGTVNGYVLGYRDAYRAVNSQYDLIFSQLDKMKKGKKSPGTDSEK